MARAELSGRAYLAAPVSVFKSNTAEFMQYRLPVGRGPSSNTWPRCDPHREQVTSVLRIPCEPSTRSLTAFSAIGLKKLGQPVPESNFVPASNSSCPQTAQR